MTESFRAEQGKESMKYVGFRTRSYNCTKDNFCCILFQFCMVAGMCPEAVSKTLAKLCTTPDSWERVG